MYRGPEIYKATDGTLGAAGISDDSIAGLVLGGILPASGYGALGETKKLIQASDADAFGIDAAYDANNKILVRHHIDEFFRLAPKGTLYIMVVPQGTTLKAMVTNTNNYVNKLIIDSARKVKHIGVVLNPDASYVPVPLNGLDKDTLDAVPVAQTLVNVWAQKNVFIDTVIIDGHNANGSIAAMLDIRTLASPNVGICILQDGDVAALDALYGKYSAVGSVLGGLAVREVEEDLGSLQGKNNPNKGAADMPIDDAATGKFLNVAISSGVSTSNLSTTEVEALKTKGYIFADSYPEYPGVFFSAGSACTSATSDYAFFVNTRVYNKVARKVVFKLTPKFNGTVETDDLGNLKVTTISGWEADTNNSRNGIGLLVAQGHCQKTSVFIDPNQNLNTNPKIKVGIRVKPFGYSREIEGEIGFSIN